VRSLTPQKNLPLLRQNLIVINDRYHVTQETLRLSYEIHLLSKIPEDISCKYLGIIIRSDLSWADQVNNTVQKAWRALYFVMRVVKKGNKNTKSVAYKSLVRPILEYGAACWDPYRNAR
jgi:hypothetical protein